MDDKKARIAPEQVSAPIPSESDEQGAGAAMACLSQTFAETAVAALLQPPVTNSPGPAASAAASYTQMDYAADLSMRVNSDNDIESIVITPLQIGTRFKSSRIGAKRGRDRDVRPASISPDRVQIPIALVEAPRVAAVGRKRQKIVKSAAVIDEEQKSSESDEFESNRPDIVKPVNRKFASVRGHSAFQSVAAAAAQTGLPKGVVKNWVAQGLVATLRPGSDHSHRLVDVQDLQRLVELKRESADKEAREELEQMHRDSLLEDSANVSESPSRSFNSQSRTLLYVRIDSAPDLTEEHYNVLFKEMFLRLHQACGISNDAASRAVCSEIAAAKNLDRDGFTAIVMEVILNRKIDRLVVMHRNHLCPESAWPLFLWLAKQHDVAIICAEQ